MKIEFSRKLTWFTKKTSIIIHDYQGEMKELETILKNLKVVPK